MSVIAIMALSQGAFWFNNKRQAVNTGYPPILAKLVKTFDYLLHQILLRNYLTGCIIIFFVALPVPCR